MLFVTACGENLQSAGAATDISMPLLRWVGSFCVLQALSRPLHFTSTYDKADDRCSFSQ